jgi:hypothetical protein
MRSLKTVRSGNYNIDKTQDNLAQYFKRLQGLFLLDGILHKEIEINTTFALEHKLGRVPIGYLVIKKDSAASIYNGEITSTLLNFSSSANVTADIWVF